MTSKVKVELKAQPQTPKERKEVRGATDANANERYLT